MSRLKQRCMHVLNRGTIKFKKIKNKKLNEKIVYMHTFQLKKSKIINNIENKKF